jgi:hypothetical protein
MSGITFDNPRHLGATEMTLGKIVDGKVVSDGAVALPK